MAGELDTIETQHAPFFDGLSGKKPRERKCFCVMECIDDKTFQIGDVDGAINRIEGAVGFILYIKNGFVLLLEGYTNVIDKWLNLMMK